MKVLSHSFTCELSETTFICAFLFLFSALTLNAQLIPIDQTFSNDTVFRPFSGNTPVYSLSIDGGIQLNSDSSLVRVILIDQYGNNYLVFESYPLITLTNEFDTLDAADETRYLDGVICDSIRVDIINASIDLENLHLDTNYIANALEFQAQAKWDNDSVKIKIMNQRILEEHMYWRAGRTGMVDLFFQEKELRFGTKFFGDGIEYYMGGIYEKSAHRSVPEESATYVGTFDWRSRHGASDPLSPYWDGQDDTTGWITGIRDQENCGTCWLFSGVGAIEADLNLYYNILSLIHI